MAGMGRKLRLADGSLPANFSHVSEAPMLVVAAAMRHTRKQTFVSLRSSLESFAYDESLA